jgi:hypothetical protein
MPGPTTLTFDKGTLLVRGAKPVNDLWPHLPGGEVPEEHPRRDLSPAALAIPTGAAVSVAIAAVAKANRCPTAQSRDLLEARGFVCAGGFALRRKALPQLRERVRAALPDLARVEQELQEVDLSAAILQALGFQVKCRGLEDAVVLEK